MAPAQIITDSSPFSWIDWGVIAVYLALTTLIGARLAGNQSTIREFFLAGRKLPWWAVCGSIIATEISAITFIAVPTISFRAGGNLTYLQLAAGAILARVAIGYLFVPRYYREEIYSPYDYLGQQLGNRVKKITTLLFFLGAVLGQGARVFVTAFLLSKIADIDLVTSIWLIGIVSIGWTLMGGITTVIWTDVIQFCVLIVGAIVMLLFALDAVPGGLDEVIVRAEAAAKFQWLDTRTDPSLEYTIWAGLLAFPFLNLAAFGLDQVMAQRMFCCRNAAQARRAIIWSCSGIVVALLMLGVGIALFAYFHHQPFTPDEQADYTARKNYLLPIFIIRELPVGVRGIIVAAIFAAAISSLDSALAALAQTTIGAFKTSVTKLLGRLGIRSRRLSSDIDLSKCMIVVWGAALCGMATACIAISEQYDNVVNLAFGLTAYTYGPLLGIFLLAFLPVRRDDAGLTWAVPITILTIFGISVHVQSTPVGWLGMDLNWADWVVWIGAAAIFLLGLIRLKGKAIHITVVSAGVAVSVLFHCLQVGLDEQGDPKFLSWVWCFPIGTVMTFVVGYTLGRPIRASRSAHEKGPAD